MSARVWRLVAVLVAVAVAAAGCTAPARDAAGEASVDVADRDAGGGAPVEGGGRAEGVIEAGPEGRVLGDEWYVDANRNGLPDVVERELGLALDGCAMDLGCEPPPGAVAGAEALEELERARATLLILDASGSMAAPADGGRSRMQAAREALAGYVAATPEFVDLGLMVYGHRGSNSPEGKAESCAGVEVLAGLGAFAPDSADGVLGGFAPTGYTPLGRSLEEALGVFAGREGGVNRVIVVTDGIETCEGDPVGAARVLQQAGVAVTVDVVGFGVESGEAAALQAIADAGGGSYTDAATGAELEEHFLSGRAEVSALRQWVRCLTDGWLVAGACHANRTFSVQAELLRRANAARDAGREAERHELLRLANQTSSVSVAYQRELEARAQEVLVPAREALEAAEARAAERGERVGVAPAWLAGGVAGGVWPWECPLVVGVGV